MLMRYFSPRSVKLTLWATILFTGIAFTLVGASALATPGCRPVNGHLDSVAADLDGNPVTLETVGTLIGGIRADFEFRDFSPSPSGVLPTVQFYTGTIELTLSNGTIVKGIDTGVLDAATGELTELTTFTEKDGQQ